ncbi:MAG: hypothetical protein ACXAEN_19280 [Candidatus Thorarchaeota archaeon]|jgi:hypothetical protein
MKRLYTLFAIIGLVLLTMANGGSECDQSPNCTKIDNPGNSGSLRLGVEGCWITTAVIKAGQGLFQYNPPLESYSDGNYRITLTDQAFTWETLVGQDVSHIQLWYECDVPATHTPEPTATDTPVPTNTPEPTPTDEPTSTPDPTSTVEPTETPTPFMTPTPWTPQCTNPGGCNGLG